MNGVRSTFMRRGYLLTALSALLLLAASAGTASAQVTVAVPKTVTEGGTITVTVNVAGYVHPTTAGGSIQITAEPATRTPTAAEAGVTDGETNDWNTNLTVPATIRVPAGVEGASPYQFSQSGSITIQTLNDIDAEDEAVTVTVNFNGSTDISTIGLRNGIGGTTTVVNLPDGYTADHPLVIDDDETQTYKLTLAAPVAPMMPTEGQEVTVNLTADPPHTDQGRSRPLTLDLDPTVAGLAVNTVQGNTATVTGAAAQEITFTPGTGANGDGNRVTDTYTLTVYSGNAISSNVEAALEIAVTDAHTLPKVDAVLVDAQGRHLDPQPTSVEEGSEVRVKFRVLSAPAPGTGRRTPVGTTRSPAGEKLKIQLNPTGDADSADYSLVQVIEIDGAAGESAPVTLEVLSDEDVGMETLAIDAVVSGDAMKGTETETTSNVLSLMIEDGTAKKIWTKSEDDAYPKITAAIEAGAGDEGLNPGESFMINTSDLFGYAEGYTASFSAASDSDAVSVSASGSTITAMAESTGSAKVTITGTATMASSSFAPSQTVSNVASVTFEVMVVDKMLTLMIEMPDNVMEGNIVEGMSYHIPVTTNRGVNEDTEVTFARDRSQSDADEDDYSIGAVTIMAGEHMAMAELMVTEDMMDDAGHAMGEQLVIYAMAGDVESDELMFTIWDEAVPALPLIAQLLLALFLMAGGARLYRRRQS